MKQVFAVPGRGDVIRIVLRGAPARRRDPRPALLVLSPQAYNARVGLALVCPVASRFKGYPFEVPLPPDIPVAGAVLADQAACLDWRAHRAETVCSLPAQVVEEVLGKLRALLA